MSQMNNGPGAPDNSRGDLGDPANRNRPPAFTTIMSATAPIVRQASWFVSAVVLALFLFG